MAETCIVCLGDLHSHNDATFPSDAISDSKSPLRVSTPAATLETPQPAPSDSDDELVAHLLPCGHFLHDGCLKPWVERANSCPICRQTFNMVELSASLGGPIISSYSVQDKQQVAELDPAMIIEEDDPDSHGGPCMVCEVYGDDSELMFCDGCSNTCHIMCSGLDSLPLGAWFCHTCQEDPQVLGRHYRRPSAARRNDRRNRRSDPPQAWESIWRSVYRGAGIDLDDPWAEQESAARRRSADTRREVLALQRRYEVAERQGAGAQFRTTAAILREADRPPPPQEDQEELNAWKQFEKFRASNDGAEQQPCSRISKTLKRKSPTTSPRETAPLEPSGRKLKRPRTRVVPSEPAAESSTATRRARPAPSAPQPRRPHSHITNGPTFLQSLLNEVETNPFPSGPEADTSDAASGYERSPSPRVDTSVNASPAVSNHPSPRAMTPPPHSPGARPASPPPLASIISPIFPPAPEFSPFSPAIEDSTNRARSRQRPANNSSPAHSPSHSPTRPPISYEMKAEIAKMVGVALKPHYRRQELTKEEYTIINQDVSRMLYQPIWDAGGLVDAVAREKWQNKAADEVATAVKGLKKDDEQSTPTIAMPSPKFTATVRA